MTCTLLGRIVIAWLFGGGRMRSRQHQPWRWTHQHHPELVVGAEAEAGAQVGHTLLEQVGGRRQLHGGSARGSAGWRCWAVNAGVSASRPDQQASGVQQAVDVGGTSELLCLTSTLFMYPKLASWPSISTYTTRRRNSFKRLPVNVLSDSRFLSSPTS